MKAPGKSLISFHALLLLLCLASACAWVGNRFGPADKGGNYLIINVKSDAAQIDETVARTMAVMQKRCELLGVRCRAERLGEHGSRIKISIASHAYPERTKRILLTQGQGLEMRAVVSPSSPAPLQTYPTETEAAAAAGTDKDVLPYTEASEDKQTSGKRFIVVERAPIITGEDVREAEAATGYIPEKYQINFRLTPEGADRFGKWTSANINHYIAVVMNKEVRSVAYIKGQIYDSGQITGRYTKEQAEDIAMLLMSGSLPAPVEALEEGVYKP